VVYILEILSGCGCKVPLILEGNVYSLGALTAKCQKCHAPGNIISVQDVVLDSTHPDFEATLERLTENFSALSFYLATVDKGVCTLTVRFRKSIKVDFSLTATCKTCFVTHGFDPQLKDFVRAHGGHECEVAFGFPPNDAGVPLPEMMQNAVKDFVLKAWREWEDA
jgi:hypothetical protein